MVYLTPDEPRDELDMLIPFSVTVRADGLMTECSESLALTAHEFERRFYKNPMSEEAREFIRAELENRFDGFSLSQEDLMLDTITYEYGGNADDLVSGICEGTVIIPEAELSSYDNLTAFEADELGDHTLPTAAVIKDGKIVALAGINAEPSDGEAEISVDTAENYRRFGYGTSCAAALTKHLCDLGLSVKYVCFGTNEPSKALADKLGFREECRCFDAVFFKN